MFRYQYWYRYKHKNRKRYINGYTVTTQHQAEERCVRQVTEAAAAVVMRGGTDFLGPEFTAGNRCPFSRLRNIYWQPSCENLTKKLLNLICFYFVKPGKGRSKYSGPFIINHNFLRKFKFWNTFLLKKDKSDVKLKNQDCFKVGFDLYDEPYCTGINYSLYSVVSRYILDSVLFSVQACPTLCTCFWQ